MSVEQIVNAPFLYVNNLQLAWGSNTTLTVAAGQCRDSTNTIDMTLSESVTINAAVNGANGLDTGTFASSTWYNVFLIGDFTGFNAPKALLSVSATAPTMPSGYGAIRWLGTVKSDGSTHFYKFYQSGVNSSRLMQWDSPISILSGGSSATFAAINASTGGAPKLATPIYLNIAYTPVTAASTGSIRPTGSTAAAGSCPINLKGNVNAVAFNDNMVKILPQLSSGNASLDYIVTASDALSLSVAAYELSL